MRLNIQPYGKAHLMCLFLLCAVQLLLGVLYLGTVPRVHIDEVWDASLGYELAESGVLRHPFIRNFGGMEVYFVQPRLTLPIVCAGLFKVTGYSIALSRLPSLLFGILAVIALYHISERFFGGKQSFFICLVTITNAWFWINSRRCRPEMYYTAFALVFLWLAISYFHRDRKVTAFLAGIAAVLASLAHPNGLLIVAAISISWLIWKEKPHLFKFVIWSLAGFLLLFLSYVIYALWASGQPNVSFIKQVQLGYPSVFSSITVKEISRWKTFFQPPFGIPAALVMIAAWLSAWWKSTAEDKFTATVIAVYLLALPFFSVNALAYYLVAVTPFFGVLVVRFIYRLRDFACFGDSKKLYYVIRIVVVLMFVIPSLSAIFLMLYKQRGTNFNVIVNEVAKVVGPNKRVHADPVFWIGHDKYIYGPYLITYNVVKGSEALQWAYHQSFEYVIRTTWDGCVPQQGVRSQPKDMPGFRSHLIGDHLCKMFGNKVYEFYNEDYGPIEIYKINWPANPASWGLKKQAVK
jgi:4-amino-4-deoxy-L-arabinose transferase-like glycosyltransferase